jgi:hypothetical protein
LHDQIIFVLNLIPDGSIPIDRTKQIGGTFMDFNLPFSQARLSQQLTLHPYTKLRAKKYAR